MENHNPNLKPRNNQGRPTTMKRKAKNISESNAVNVHGELLSRPALTSHTVSSGDVVAATGLGTKPIYLQSVDIDMYRGFALRANPNPLGELVGPAKGACPVVRLYGVTETGNTVLVHVHGFTPYIYCAIPDDFEESEIETWRAKLESILRTTRTYKTMQGQDIIVHVRIQKKTSVMTYQSEKNQNKRFLQVFFRLPNFVPAARRELHSGQFTWWKDSDILSDDVQEARDNLTGHALRWKTYESNVPYVLRFMIDTDIVGSNWIELPANTYTVRGTKTSGGSARSHGSGGYNSNPTGRIQSRCQLEVDICYDELISKKTIGKWMKIAPLRIASFDIECMGRKGHFPEPEKDPVIQIATVLQVQGEDKPYYKSCLVLGSCTPIVGVHLQCFDREEDLLNAFAKLLREADPDVLTGYNICNFDLPYLINRAKTLKIHDQSFAYFGRIKNDRVRMEKKVFQSAAYGKRENMETTIQGRLIMDMIVYMFRNQKLSSYSLNNVSAKFLGQQKEDVHHSIIGDLHRGSADDRNRLAVYCVKDALLPLRLMNKLVVMFNYVEMARVTGVPISFLLTRGQQIKVYSMLLRKCRNEGLIIPTNIRRDTGPVTFEGATVIEPKKGFYRTPIATLDFASLYPSIMMAHNLCYTTYLGTSPFREKPFSPPYKVEECDPFMIKACEENNLMMADIEKGPNGHVFVRATKTHGLLPRILKELLDARKVAKKDMKAAKDPLIKNVMNGRQLALKVSANSVYGFTGATVGMLPLLAISSTVTAFGRQMIDDTKNMVEKTYTIANGYPANAEVVYGDTDSVMIKFGVDTVKEAIDLGEVAAEVITKIFPNPVKLEFEKVYSPYLLINKKRYAGLFWTRPDKYDKMDTKGIETVRRDNCALVRTVIGTCLNKLLIDQDTQGAIDYTKGVISDLLQGKIDISMLVITKALSKMHGDEDYLNKQPHVELAYRMKKRDPGSAPALGDRVPYVIVQSNKKARAYEKSEDPIYVLKHGLSIDTNYYLSNQLEKPLVRIFEPVIGDTARSVLLSGDHTRKIKVAKATARAGSIMMFAKKVAKCLGCKNAMRSSSKSGLCESCKPYAAEYFLKSNAKMQGMQRHFQRLWTECQRCQGSLHQDVLCSNKDCPIFYMRTKAQKDLTEATDNFLKLKGSLDW
eukprot:g885.t1